MTMKLDESLFTVPGVGRGLRFYVTGATPCPYLDGQMERKAFTHLNQSAPDTLHNQLSEAGFRRSQSVAYRPACPSCNACRSVRVDASRFSPSRNQARILKRNADLVRRPVAPKATREQFRLLKRYLVSRHEGGGMSDMGFREFAGMVNETPVQTLMFEYREGPEEDAPLVAVSLTDVLRDGFSMVYTFFDTRQPKRSLGTYLILDHIRSADDYGLPHVYLGYWIKQSPKMDYKRRFQPLEVLDGAVWRPLEEED
ncbi:arginyltransferase [Henriciella barbarensis]|uniref:Aspartate/glutamate leucyltransferase n=1 Tax=Henriciella barbarensis TaxID=86342 RepID=A0A399QQZ9_9PROT|nr:arginyltransferase [Henriciella barbarensis]RIJ20605.1 arginyltransferase [Henriciella barbarensis]